VEGGRALTCGLFLAQAFHLVQHFFHPAADVFPILAQLHQFAAQRLILFFALFQLLPQPPGIALGMGARFLGGLV
jgi:hypothetical protein